MNNFLANGWQHRQAKRIQQNRERESDDEASSTTFLLCSALMQLQEEEQKSARFKACLSLEGSHRRDRRIPREALVDPTYSAWEKLYQSRNDQALITVTGFDHRAFAMLLEPFKYLFDNFTPWTGTNDGSNFKRIEPNNLQGGRPRMINASACLGLVLAWYRFMGATFVLQGWFGFTGTPANVWLRFGRRMLLIALERNPKARVKLPTDEQIDEYKLAVANRHPSLKNVYCVADGLKIRFESCSGLSKQGMYYNGWQHGHYVTNLFVFGADGRIIACVLNAPGSLHDSTLAEWGNIYQELESIYNRTGGICCLDSAFASCDAPFLIRSSENLTRAKTPLEVIQMQEATSLRQAAEWGMRAIQGSFPRLKDKIRYEENGERRIMLSLVVLIYNYRLEVVGLNQIRNVYLPELSKDATYLMRGVV